MEIWHDSNTLLCHILYILIKIDLQVTYFRHIHKTNLTLQGRKLFYGRLCKHYRILWFDINFPLLTGIDTFGKNAVVCGRSKNIGMPVAALLHSDGDNGRCFVIIMKGHVPIHHIYDLYDRDLRNSPKQLREILLLLENNTWELTFCKSEMS